MKNLNHFLSDFLDITFTISNDVLSMIIKKMYTRRALGLDAKLLLQVPRDGLQRNLKQ